MCHDCSVFGLSCVLLCPLRPMRLLVVGIGLSGLMGGCQQRQVGVNRLKYRVYRVPDANPPVRPAISPVTNGPPAPVSKSGTGSVSEPSVQGLADQNFRLATCVRGSIGTLVHVAQEESLNGAVQKIAIDCGNFAVTGVTPYLQDAVGGGSEADLEIAVQRAVEMLQRSKVVVEAVLRIPELFTARCDAESSLEDQRMIMAELVAVVRAMNGWECVQSDLDRLVAFAASRPAAEVRDFQFEGDYDHAFRYPAFDINYESDTEGSARFESCLREKRTDFTDLIGITYRQLHERFVEAAVVCGMTAVGETYVSHSPIPSFPPAKLRLLRGYTKTATDRLAHPGSVLFAVKRMLHAVHERLERLPDSDPLTVAEWVRELAVPIRGMQEHASADAYIDGLITDPESLIRSLREVPRRSGANGSIRSLSPN